MDGNKFKYFLSIDWISILILNSKMLYGEEKYSYWQIRGGNISNDCKIKRFDLFKITKNWLGSYYVVEK